MPQMQPIKVAPNIYRGPQPKSADDWAKLQLLGIKYTLDLQTGWFGDGDIHIEQMAAANYMITAFSLPLSGILPPNSAQLTWAYHMIDVYKPIYVHCKDGVDRTGMVIADWQCGNGLTRAQAIQEMYSRGMHWWLKWWAWFLP